MEQRIRVGVLVVADGCLLLVKHKSPLTGREWWATPGGGVVGTETLWDCAVRETFEETGVRILPGEILYLRQFVDREFDRHNLEVFIVARSFQGVPTIANLKPEDPDYTYVKEARFLSPQEMVSLVVFPEVLKADFWEHIQEQEPRVRYLGLSVG